VKLFFKGVRRLERDEWVELHKELADISATCEPSKKPDDLGLDIIRVAGLVVVYNAETEIMKHGDRRVPDPQKMKDHIIRICKEYGFNFAREE
jgi:hypothetical protein